MVFMVSIQVFMVVGEALVALVSVVVLVMVMAIIECEDLLLLG